jgi:hypothetical protein
MRSSYIDLILDIPDSKQIDLVHHFNVPSLNGYTNASTYPIWLHQEVFKNQCSKEHVKELSVPIHFYAQLCYIKREILTSQGPLTKRGILPKSH